MVGISKPLGGKLIINKFYLRNFSNIRNKPAHSGPDIQNLLSRSKITIFNSFFISMIMHITDFLIFFFQTSRAKTKNHPKNFGGKFSKIIIKNLCLKSQNKNDNNFSILNLDAGILTGS